MAHEEELPIVQIHDQDADRDRSDLIGARETVLDTIIEAEEFYEQHPDRWDAAAQRHMKRMKDDVKDLTKQIKWHAHGRQNFYGDWARLNLNEPVQMMRGYGEGRYSRRVAGPGAYRDPAEIEKRRRAALQRLHMRNMARYWDNMPVNGHAARYMQAIGRVAPIGSNADRRRYAERDLIDRINRGREYEWRRERRRFR